MNTNQNIELIPETFGDFNSEVSRLQEHIGETVTLHGSIYKIRKMKGFSFLILRTARFCIQCVCDSQEILSELQEEACVRMEAEVVQEERAKLKANSM